MKAVLERRELQPGEQGFGVGFRRCSTGADEAALRALYRVDLVAANFELALDRAVAVDGEFLRRAIGVAV
jgi:hypothetical protein